MSSWCKSWRALPWLLAVLCLPRAFCDVSMLPSQDDKPTQKPMGLPSSASPVEGFHGNALLQTQLRLVLTRAKMSCMTIEQRLRSALDTKLSVHSSKAEVKMAKVENNIQAVSTKVDTTKSTISRIENAMNTINLKVDNAVTSMTQKVNNAISMMTNKMNIAILAAEHRLMAFLARNHEKTYERRSLVTRQPPVGTTVLNVNGQNRPQSDKPNICCSGMESKWNNTLAAKIDETKKRSETEIGELKQLLSETKKELLASANTLQMQVSTDQAKMKADIANLTGWVQSQIAGVQHTAEEMKSSAENKTKELDDRLNNRMEGLKESILMRQQTDFDTYVAKQNKTMSVLRSHIEESNKRHQEVNTAIQESENKTGVLLDGLHAKHMNDFVSTARRHNDSLSSLLFQINTVMDDMAQQNASVNGLLHHHSDTSDQRLEELKEDIENLTETLEDYLGDARRRDSDQDASLELVAERLNKTVQQLQQRFQDSDDAMKARVQGLQGALRNLSASLVCREEALINGSTHGVSDNQLTASSSWDDSHGPDRSRLHTEETRYVKPGAWCSRSLNKTQWIQVDFLKQIKALSISTQGRGAHSQWVKSYMIQYSNNGQSWSTYYEGAMPKVFRGNWDMNSVRTNRFAEPFVARFIRLNPVTWNNHISLRWEVYGCLRP